MREAQRLKDASLDIRKKFRKAVSNVIRKKKLDRWQIAAQVSRLSGHELSKDILDKYTSINFDYGFRAEDLPALAVALGTLEPFKVLLNFIGADVIHPETELEKLARLEKKHAELFEELATLRAKLGIRK